jgi:hypothetical protein
MVTGIDKTHKDAQRNFMKEITKSRNAFLWSSPKDEIRINFSDILWIIEEPIPFGKSKCVFKLNKEATMRNFGLKKKTPVKK